MVAGLVAEGVVDVLEIPQVQAHRRHSAMMARGLEQPLAQPVEQQRPVGQVGEFVMVGEILEPGVCPDALGDVAIDAAIAREPALVVEDRDAAGLDYHPAAVLAQVHILQPFERFARHRDLGELLTNFSASSGGMKSNGVLPTTSSGA